MTRALAESVVLFLVPFAVFAVLLVLTKRDVLHIGNWSTGGTWLAAAGLVLVILAFLARGFLLPRPEAGFEPTHVEDGRVVPGRFR